MAESKYFSYLSSLAVKELHDIARESGLCGYSSLRKYILIRFLDKRIKVIKNCLERRMFPDAMKAWVELFVPNKSTTKHYAQIILKTLSPISFFSKNLLVRPRMIRRGRCRCTSTYDEDIGDDWRRRSSYSENDSNNDNDSDSTSDSTSERGALRKRKANQRKRYHKSMDSDWYAKDSESSDDDDDMINDGGGRTAEKGLSISKCCEKKLIL